MLVVYSRSNLADPGSIPGISTSIKELVLDGLLLLSHRPFHFHRQARKGSFYRKVAREQGRKESKGARNSTQRCKDAKGCQARKGSF